MDVGLKACKFKVIIIAFFVSILVLMDVGLKVIPDLIPRIRCGSFNPCSDGCWSQSGYSFACCAHVLSFQSLF